MIRQVCFSALLGAALIASANAQEPYWSLSVGTPGLAANIGNVLAAPVVVAPPVVYAPPPPPVVYYSPGSVEHPGYGWRRHGRWRHDDDDERGRGDR